MTKFKVEIMFKMDIPPGLCVEEITGHLKQHITSGKFIIQKYQVYTDDNKKKNSP